MKDCLGGTAKTLMIVNCSPSTFNKSETNNSLQYALSVKKIKNNVTKNVETKEILKFKNTVTLLESQMSKLGDLIESSDRSEEFSTLQMEF